MTIRAVTLDAYGTLLDLDSQAEPAVRAIVAEQGIDLVPAEVARAWTESFFALLHAYDAEEPLPFRTIRELTAESLGEVLRRFRVAGDVERGVEVWFDHVRAASPYPEAPAAVEALAEKFRLAVVSDADDDFLIPALERARLPIEIVVTSEAACCYKIAPGGSLFQKAFEALGVEPSEVAHVGDSAADVVGAVRAGARAVWLSRDGRGWEDTRAGPGFVARDLAEAAEMLVQASPGAIQWQRSWLSSSSWYCQLESWPYWWPGRSTRLSKTDASARSAAGLSTQRVPRAAETSARPAFRPRGARAPDAWEPSSGPAP